MLSEELRKKIELYEQIFFGLDKPVPFKDNLFIYPVKVKDYYTFYSNLSCFQMDKTVIKRKDVDKYGREITVSEPNAKGISQSYMAYLIEQMENPDYGRQLTAQVIQLLELLLHIKNGFYCPHCHGKINNMDNRDNINNNSDKNIDNKPITDELTYDDMLEDTITLEKQGLEEDQLLLAKQMYFMEKSKCPICGNQRKDIIGIYDDKKGKINSKKLQIYDSILLPKEFDELIAIALHYNILNYEGDSYMDPKLKEAMEIKANLENKNYNAPSLEKQLVCISISSPYRMEELQELTLRKMTLMLKTIDAKLTYQAQMQGMMSGMVTFKHDPPHWIFSSDKVDMSKKVMDIGAVKDKFAHLPG